MAPAADAVVQAAVFQEDAAHNVQLREEPHRAEYGGPADAAGLPYDVVDREMAALSEYGGDDGHP